MQFQERVQHPVPWVFVQHVPGVYLVPKVAKVQNKSWKKKKVTLIWKSNQILQSKVAPVHFNIIFSQTEHLSVRQSVVIKGNRPSSVSWDKKTIQHLTPRPGDTQWFCVRRGRRWTRGRGRAAVQESALVFVGTMMTEMANRLWPLITEQWFLLRCSFSHVERRGLLLAKQG